MTREHAAGEKAPEIHRSAILSSARHGPQDAHSIGEAVILASGWLRRGLIHPLSPCVVMAGGRCGIGNRPRRQIKQWQELCLTAPSCSATCKSTAYQATIRGNAFGSERGLI